MTELLDETSIEAEWLPWLRLSLTDGIGKIRANELLERYGSAEAILAQPERELVAGGHIPQPVAARLLSADRLAEARNELARLRRVGAQLVHLRGPGYPEVLDELRYPPVVLGHLGPLLDPGRRGVVIVGSRKAGPRALRIAYEFAREMAENGIIIVSGLAKGVDRAAHEGALAAREGRTIAVLGCGLARVYPAEHAKLAARIRERGSLVSEFPADAPPTAFHFPMRNRIIAGLSVATVVIAAGDRSGALITAEHAHDGTHGGRPVYAVPGSLDDALARGTNDLIKRAEAHLVEGAKDVLLDLGFLRHAPGVDERPPLIPRANREPLPGVPGDIERYLEGKGTTCTFDEIVFDNRLDARAAMSALGFLAVRRRVREIPGIGYEVAEG